MDVVYLTQSIYHSLLFISLKKNPFLVTGLLLFVISLIFCFSNNSSTYDDNDSGVQDTVLTPPTKQYGSYIDGKHPTPPHL